MVSCPLLCSYLLSIGLLPILYCISVEQTDEQTSEAAATVFYLYGGLTVGRQVSDLDTVSRIHSETFRNPFSCRYGRTVQKAF